MAEFKFPCPACYQSIICDELWSGQQIQCPSCNSELIVPQKPASTGSPLVPEVPAGPGKLSIGKPQAGVTGAAHPAQKFIPSLGTTKVVAKKKTGLMNVVKIGAAVILLGVAGYLGYGWWSKRQETSGTPPQVAKNPEAYKPGRRAKAAPAAEPATEETPAAAPAEKPLPVIAPVWTLDVALAKIPEGLANGKIAGANFVLDAARLDRVGTAQVLALRQGTGPTADREFLIYLHPAAGETLPGHTWTISQEMKPPVAPQVLKRWKTDPKFAPQQKAFSSGYAMKLEFGQTNETGLPGKIFLALPDPEQSVVAGIFKVQASTNSAAAQTSAQPMIDRAPAPAAGQSPNRAAFDKRYGIKR
jgi:DNA-directed RNA polymerase subunit RPC12/RpoP